MSEISWFDHVEAVGVHYENSPTPAYCLKCEVYHFNGEHHICIRWNESQPCVTCGAPTIVCTIASPGYGMVRECKNRHTEELSLCGEYTPAQVR